MAIHIGKKIKEEVYRQAIPINVFAKKINRSRNVVYDIFERESIDTALLNKIGKTLNVDFFSLYSGQKEYNQDGIKNFHASEPAASYNKSSEEIKALQKENEIFRNEISYLKKIIQLLETKHKK
jgi:phosphorylcholine metabolism protein LicD